jgi:replicative DNA helicase
VLESIRYFGLEGKYSPEKYVPSVYLNSCKSVRLDLLKGLMDSDGSVEGAHNVPVFNTSSRRLAEDVQYLVRSLGGIATISSRIPTFTHKGQKKQGLEAFRVFIKLKFPVFEHSLKAERVKQHVREARLKIVSIEPAGEEECQCISVSHPSKLYVTDGFIVTHNSTLALNQLDYSVRKYEEPGLMICLEMHPKRLVRKWISMVTETPDSPQVPLTMEAIDIGLGVACNYKADLLFGYSKHRKFEQIAETIYQAKRRYGVKHVVFDNLQMLVQSLEHSQQETSKITKGFKGLMMELNQILHLIIQPHRVREGEIVAARNSAGSSAIEKDVDVMLALHRNREGKISAKEFDQMGQLEIDTNFSPPMLVRADLTRYSAGGATTLWLQGDLSKVYELDEGRARFGRGMAQHAATQEAFGLIAA